MKFKHTVQVFIDNFSVTYKQLLYRLVILLIAAGLYAAVCIPFINSLTGSPDYVNLISGIKAFVNNFLEGKISEIGEASAQIKHAFDALLRLVAENREQIAWGIVGCVVIYLVQKFFEGLGNYATTAVINDKMALHANSPFMVTLIHNFKSAALYSLIHSPISFIYDALCWLGMYFVIFRLLSLILVPLPIQIFLYVTAIIVIATVKMTFTSDWMPALIRGKMKQKEAFLYTFDRRRKQSFNVFSNYGVLVLIIFAVNVGGALCTFGAALLITVPSSYVILVCFECVNYFDREELKYFIDKYTIIKPEKERTVTREEFFKGEQ